MICLHLNLVIFDYLIDLIDVASTRLFLNHAYRLLRFLVLKIVVIKVFRGMLLMVITPIRVTKRLLMHEDVFRTDMKRYNMRLLRLSVKGNGVFTWHAESVVSSSGLLVASMLPCKPTYLSIGVIFFGLFISIDIGKYPLTD